MDRTLSPKTPIDSPMSPGSPAYDWRNAQTGTGKAVTIVRSGRATPPAKLDTKTSFEFIYDARRASYLDDTPVEENGLPWPEEAGPPPMPARSTDRTTTTTTPAEQPMSEARQEKLDLERIQSAYGVIAPPMQTHPAHFAPYADPSPTSPCPIDSAKIALLHGPADDSKIAVLESPADDDPIFVASAAFISTFSPSPTARTASTSLDSFASRHSTGSSTSTSTSATSRASSRGPAPLHHLPLKPTSPNTPHVPPPTSPFILFSPYDNIDATPYHAFPPSHIHSLPSTENIDTTAAAAAAHKASYTPITWSNTQAPKRRWYAALRGALRNTLTTTDTLACKQQQQQLQQQQRPHITVLRDGNLTPGQPLGPHRRLAQQSAPPTPPKSMDASPGLEQRARGLSIGCDAARHPSLVPAPLQVVKSPRCAHPTHV